MPKVFFNSKEAIDMREHVEGLELARNFLKRCLAKYRGNIGVYCAEIVETSNGGFIRAGRVDVLGLEVPLFEFNDTENLIYALLEKYGVMHFDFHPHRECARVYLANSDLIRRLDQSIKGKVTLEKIQAVCLEFPPFISKTDEGTCYSIWLAKLPSDFLSTFNVDDLLTKNIAARKKMDEACEAAQKRLKGAGLFSRPARDEDVMFTRASFGVRL